MPGLRLFRGIVSVIGLYIAGMQFLGTAVECPAQEGKSPAPPKISGDAARPDAAPPDAAPPDAALGKLDEITRRATAFFHKAPRLHVESTTRWTFASSPPRAGVTRCRLSIRQPGAFRLEVSADGEQNSSLTCVSDGKTLTRLYRGGPLSLISRHDGGMERVLDDPLTDSSLKGTGLNIILRRDVHEFVMETVANVKHHGQEEVQGVPAEHFSMQWIGGSMLDVWIASGDEPLVLRWRRVMRIDSGSGEAELRMDSQMVWKRDADLSDDQIRIQPPANAIEVPDIQTYLLKGGTDALLGQPAPAISLKRLDGTEWQLDQHRGKQIVVLFFFATWATPSTLDMPRLLAFIDEYKDRGVAFHAINLGEKPEVVRAFLEATRYTHPVVLDPQQKAATAYRITSLPVTVMIGKDGSLQAVHVGTTPETRELIRGDLQYLVEGKSLVKPGK